MAANSLGLQLEKVHIDDTKPEEPAIAQDAANDADDSIADPDAADAPKAQAEKKVPYVNPDRVKTGGAQRERPSDEELAERMARIREQNEKIKLRREDVKADEDAFKQTQAAEARKREQSRKVQDTINRTREENAARKMHKIEAREWDAGKKDGKKDRPANNAPSAPATPANEEAPPSPEAAHAEGGAPDRGRGRGRGRGAGGDRGGRGRGRGRGGAVGAGVGPKDKDTKDKDPPPHSAASPGETSAADAPVGVAK